MTNENELNSPLPTQKTSPRLLRLFWRFIVLLLILFTFLLSAGLVIGYYYQNEVKGYIIAELNKQLNAEIIVDGKDIDFTIIKNFPYASVDFKNVKALDAIKDVKKDTLFTAGQISLQFNVVDIFHKNYHIKKIKIDDVNLKIRIDKNGNDNYHFWKTSTGPDTASFSFALEEIILNRILVSFKNYKAKQSIKLEIKNSKLSGDFSNQKYSLETESDILIDKIKSGGNSYLRKKNILLDLALQIDNTTQSYKIEKGKIQIENLVFEILGHVIDESDHNEFIVNLGIRGKNMDIKSVLSIIPNQYKEKINDYESTGKFYFDAIVKGSLAQNKKLFIDADFGIKNADITQVKNHISLQNVNLKGHFSNGNKADPSTSVLQLTPFSANINQGSVSGELSITDLDNPFIESKIKANISLEELQKFIQADTIENITGQLKMDVILNGELKNMNSSSYKDITTKGNLSITDMNLKVKNNLLNFTDINGDFNFDNDDLIVNELNGHVSESDFELKGILKNSIGFVLMENQDITIEATLHSKNINLNELLANKEEDKQSANKYKLKFSEHINVNFNSTIDHIEFRKFEANNIKGIVILKDKKMLTEGIKLSTMHGEINVSGLVDGSDSTKFVIACLSDINKINVTKLFTAFENFNQTSITDQNIKGSLTAKVEFSSVLSLELEMDMSKLFANIDMSIEKGELNNVEAMKSLSRFIELKELNTIRFAALKNSFQIKDQTLSFPKMEIKSSAININLSGTHTFNNNINYRIKLSLNELLTKKAKKAKKENNEFGELADDGLGRTNIFLSMTGTVDNPIIKYDTKGAIQNLKLELKQEKHALKSILKEEFGLFKKDSLLSKKNRKEDPKFNIKWEEVEKNEEKKELRLPKKKEEDDF